MRFVVFALAVVLLFGCTAEEPAKPTIPLSNTTNGTPAVQQNPQRVKIAEGPDFVCNIFDSRANSLGIGGADLGVPLVDGQKMWLVFGDSFVSPATSIKGPTGPAGSSSALESGIPFDCSNFTWLVSNGKYYQPLLSRRKPGDESTVPAGAITVNGTRYIFSMRVDHWSKNASDQTHAHGLLFKQDGSFFKEVAEWPVDKPFVNAAPAFGKLPDGTDAIFIALSGLYRKSPVYLAYVLPGDIENASGYHYLSGYESGSPTWTDNSDEAEPIIGDVWAGELSLTYDGPLKTYLLTFFDRGSLNLFYSKAPYGPFSGPEKSYPCGSDTSPKPSWMENGWGGCYGGYVIPEDFGPDGHDIYYTLSVWNPYTTMLMRMRLG